jgi:hypothetical protein
MLASLIGSAIVGLIVASWVAPGNAGTKALLAAGVAVALFGAIEHLRRTTAR